MACSDDWRSIAMNVLYKLYTRLAIFVTIYDQLFSSGHSRYCSHVLCFSSFWLAASWCVSTSDQLQDCCHWLKIMWIARDGKLRYCTRSRKPISVEVKNVCSGKALVEQLNWPQYCGRPRLDESSILSTTIFLKKEIGKSISLWNAAVLCTRGYCRPTCLAHPCDFSPLSCSLSICVTSTDVIAILLGFHGVS